MTAEDSVAQALSDAALADRLRDMANNLAFRPGVRQATFREAARRLTSAVRVVHGEPGGAPSNYRDVFTEMPVVRVERDYPLVWVVIDAS